MFVGWTRKSCSRECGGNKASCKVNASEARTERRHSSPTAECFCRGDWNRSKSRGQKKTKKKSRLTVDDIPTTTDVPRNQCRYTNRNQPNISPLSKNKKWYSINKFFCGTRTTPADLCDRLEPSFFAGIVFPTAMTTTTESPLWDAILFFHN